MSSVGRATRVIAGAVLLSGVLIGCGRGSEQVTVAGLPPPASPPVPTTSFQGSVASVDAETRTMVVDVQIVWTPVISAGGGERRVLVDAQTLWEPGPVELSDRLVGGEVQVEAVEAVEGVWPAVKVQLLDID
jgi:hypothetical protein